VKAPAAWFIGGPTAVGKSAVALELAARIDGEIVSVDSMQVYRGMDIGTAKPSAIERAGIPHHLIDVANLNENFDAAKFVDLAKKAEADIRTRQKIPIYCGGTGLYFNALLQGLGEAPASDPQLRAELEKLPLATLLDELKSRDPETFARIDQKNPRRIVRAIEAIRLTGKPYSQQRAAWTDIPQTIFAFDADRADLHSKINARVDRMFKAGLIDETKHLLQHGLRENRTASQALGYKQVIDHLDGNVSLAETIELVKIRTRQFAKRQLTWFRRQLPCEWVSINASDSPASLAEMLLQKQTA
jgi:tRNA dimethylallyltransferase